MFDLQMIITTAGYAGLFGIVFAESGLFFGFFLPGDSLLFTAGFLASQGILNIAILIPLLIVAAILGDSVGYSFGRYLGPKLFARKESRFFKPKYLVESHTFFVLHGRKAIFLARFLPIVRTFVPIVAGAAAMPYRDFIFYNILGGIAWVAGIVTMGFVLGQQVPNAEEYLYPIILGIILVSFLPALLHFRKKGVTEKPVSETAAR